MNDPNSSPKRSRLEDEVLEILDGPIANRH